MSIQLFFSIVGGLIAVLAVGWYCRRWGFDDGRNEGYEAGRVDGLLGRARAVTPSAAGGPGAVPR